MATDLERVRSFINDYYDSNPVQNENLSGQVDGTRTIFDLLEFRARLGKAIWNTTKSTSATSWSPPVVVHFDTSDNVSVTSYDLNLGQVTLGVTPKNTLRASYFFQRFTDTDLNNYLAEALNWIGGNTPYSSVDAAPVLLQTAAMQYSAYLAYSELAARAGHLGSTALGEARADLNEVSKHYAELAKERYTQAKEARKDFHTRADQRNAPALGWVQIDQSSSAWTPPR